ncbi:hypothetical protein Tco_0397035 [Tanacetum coccineum]
MDDEPMWAADRVVAPTPGSVITIPETANKFAIKALFDRLLGEIRAFAQHENESLTDACLRIKEMLQNCHVIICPKKNKSSLKKTVAFADEGSSNSDIDKIIARMDVMTKKMDAQYKELQSHAKQSTPDLNEDDMPMSREEEAKFMQTFRKTRFYNDYRDRDSNRDNWRSSGRNDYNRNNYRSKTDDKSYDLQKQFNDFMKSQQSTNVFVKEISMDLKTQLETHSTKPKRTHSKAYQPPQSRNEHVNVVFTRSGKSYDPPVNLNDQQNNPKTPINIDSDDKDEEPTPQPKTQNPKPIKET